MIEKFNKECSQLNIDKALEIVKKSPKEVTSFIYESPKVNTKGLLRGVPIILKDNFTTYDAPTEASSRILQGFYPFYDSTATTLLKEAGASIIAKSNLDEFAMGGTGLYSHYGQIVNPIDSNYQVGGSSSGSAYLIVNDEIGCSIASDTGDSARKPASYVGKIGYKPTYGSVSRYGKIAFASSLDTASWMTHTIYDAAIMAQVLIKKDLKDFSCNEVPFNLENVKLVKPKRIGYFIDDKNFIPEICKQFNKLIEKIKDEKVEIAKIEIDQKYIDSLLPTYKIISYSEATSNLSNLTGIAFGNQLGGEDFQEIMTKSRSNGFAYMVQRRITTGSFFMQKENQKELLLRAQKTRRVLANIWAKLLGEYDVILFPSQSGTTPLVKNTDKIAKERGNPYDDIMLFDNFLGSPSLSMPLGKIGKMPFGLSIDSQFGHDEKLLSHALYFEKILGELNE